MTRHTVDSLQDVALDTPIFHRIEQACSISEEEVRKFLVEVERWERAGGRIEETHIDDDRARGKGATLLWGEVFLNIESALQAGATSEEIAEMVEYTYPDLLGRSLDGPPGSNPWDRLIAHIDQLRGEHGPFEPIDRNENEVAPDVLVGSITHDDRLACLALHVPELRKDQEVRAACRGFLPSFDIARGLVRGLGGSDLARAFDNIVATGPGGCQAAGVLLEAHPERFMEVLDKGDLTPLLRSDFRPTRRAAIRFLHHLERHTGTGSRQR